MEGVMIDLLEKTSDGWRRVATATIRDLNQIGLFTFLRVQRILGRRIVWVKEEDNAEANN